MNDTKKNPIKFELDFNQSEASIVELELRKSDVEKITDIIYDICRKTKKQRGF